jgi:hypothetical protein
MADEVPWRPTLLRKSPFGKPVRPSSQFARIREQQPNHLEVERFEVFGPTRAEDAGCGDDVMRDLLLERVSKLEKEARGASAHYGPDA